MQGAGMSNPGNNSSQYRIGICDWTLRKQNSSVFREAQSIGFHGVQISYGEQGDTSDLSRETVRKHYIAEAEKHNIHIISMAMTNLLKFPLSYYPKAEMWVKECIESMAAMNQKIVLIPFFGRGDINDRTPLLSYITRVIRRLPPKKILRRETVRRLKILAKYAEQHGVTLALETLLDADGIKRIIDEIASPSVRVYYDIANAFKAGYDVCDEIKRLGTTYISQFHLKEEKRLLAYSEINYPGVRDAIEYIVYKDWLIIEDSQYRNGNITDDQKKNIEFVRNLFSIT